MSKLFGANEAIYPEPQRSEPEWTVLSDKGGASFTVEMPIATWISLPPHPLHRNVEKHAARDQWKLAKRAHGAVAESLRWLIGAQYDGHVYKLDGHTRAYLWANHRLPVPSSVFATIYRCKSRDEFLELYTSFETQPNTGRQQDRVAGAMREIGLELKSRRLRHGSFADVLSLAWRGKTRGMDSTGRKYEEFDIRQALSSFAPELRLLDSIGPTPEVFYTGVCAAALLALAAEPKTIEFFKDVANPAQSRREQPPYTPVQVVRREIELLRQRKKSARDRNAQETLCALVLGAIDLWQSGPSTPGFYSDGTVQPVRVIDRVRAVHATKGIPGNYFDATSTPN